MSVRSYQEVLPESLQDLPRFMEGAEGFTEVVLALSQGMAATMDGAWKSGASLAAAALGRHAPQTLLIVLAHPRDIDGWSDDLASFTGAPPQIFPAWDAMPTAETVIDDIAGQRLRVLKQLEKSPPRCLLTTLQALLQPVPDRSQLARQRRRFQVRAAVGLEKVVAWLVENGFQHMEAVELPGEFSRRGGILDVFSPDAEAPLRFEFLGDEIESIRQFAPDTQRSLGELQEVEVTCPLSVAMGPTPEPAGLEDSPRGLGPYFRGHLCDYLPEKSWTLLVETEELHEQGKHYLERVPDVTGLFSVQAVFKKLIAFPSVRLSALPLASVETTCHLRIESVERFSGDVTKIQAELDSTAANDLVLIACHNEAEQHRLSEVLGTGQLALSDRLRLALGRVTGGFRLVLSGEQSVEGETQSAPRSALRALTVLGDQELFHREQVRVLPRRRIESQAIDSFLDLKDDDLVVHVHHGIARYRGLTMLEKNGRKEEHLVLEFQGGTLVYVPAAKIDLVQKYVGGGRTEPELSKFGGLSWQKRKDRVQAAVLDLAGDMVQLQALREAQPGIALPPDTEWQKEFEAAFPYEETPDQLTTMAEIRRDLERSRPMDRLICGDVGYGKTELAIRAAFKIMDNGKQVAVLVPTTVLAEQHFRTFSQRLAEYPFVVESISRFRSHGEQKRILERLGRGGIDVIIGTHRLISQDVRFKDLGLVIIDEEQRFGVEHKERLKRLRQTVDVLTLTATPIPRTLHLALLGIRDISNLETPPAGRLAIETRIVRFDPHLVRHTILRELNRDGQVYFVHNRVFNIHEIADRLQAIVPEARIVVAHGQMNEHELEKAMVRFVQHDADILVATTIIESGLDIPNVNTIFINQADIYGLADLHQLRGRVGRYKHRAYAYLLLDKDRNITQPAAQRLKAIEEFSELGAGFKIAMRDLEIRGAGNILGNEQSGHIAAVGYELYCQLLENAVRGLKNVPLKTPVEVTLDLPLQAYLPRDYVAGQKQKIEVYRRLARIRRRDRLEDFKEELKDRFGPWPEPVDWLLRLAELRLLASHWQIASLHLEGKRGARSVESGAASAGRGAASAERLMKTADNSSHSTLRAGRSALPAPRSPLPAPLSTLHTPHFALDVGTGPVDLVLGYRNLRKIERLVKRSQGRLRVVDGSTAYFRLQPGEITFQGLCDAIKHLLRPPQR